MIYKTLSLILLVTSVSPVFASNTGDTNRWLNRNTEGWFYYNEKILPEPEEGKKKEKEPTPPVIAQPQEPQEPQDSGPTPLSSAWIRQNIQLYLDAAIDNPTPENVSAYLYIQNHAMNKSMEFMMANTKATLGNSVLDANNLRPTATFANRQLDKESTQNTELILQSISKQAGLFYFTDQTEKSNIQLEVIDMLTHNYDFDIITISSMPITDEQVKSGIRQDNGHAALMGVNYFPALVLVKADGNYDVISQAPVSYSGLKERLIVGANRLGIIDSAAFNSTSNARNQSAITIDKNKLINNPDKNASVPVPPEQIIQLFNQSN